MVLRHPLRKLHKVSKIVWKVEGVEMGGSGVGRSGQIDFFCKIVGLYNNYYSHDKIIRVWYMFTVKFRPYASMGRSTRICCEVNSEIACGSVCVLTFCDFLCILGRRQRTFRKWRSSFMLSRSGCQIHWLQRRREIKERKTEGKIHFSRILIFVILTV